MELKEHIRSLWQKKTFTELDKTIFYEFRSALDQGKIRAAEKINGVWQVNDWVKQGILIGFRMGKIIPMPYSDNKVFFDKDTYPERRFSQEDRIRIVPGGSAVREGAYVASGVVMMPPMYINVGAYIDSGTMIDSHALVGSCAQVGSNVHLSAAAQLGGVLEPIGANPVIIEDDVFVGGNCGIYEGVIISSRAIIAAGVIITSATSVYDVVNRKFLRDSARQPLVIPPGAVVVPGTRELKSNPGFSVYCPLIIKYRDAKTDAAVSFESDLR
ncbi:MAG: 2,3,4,5-tetrahydropyridine-2,6-dicarboxylate N-succinyltransferase [Candidatus Cloacimonetes bacterium]|nr:2,3,4,5-tetrahydropyridine-2,6-dicarboxylate N-succinyltransferase [Candidatus Cloacimonadota bacterium]